MNDESTKYFGVDGDGIGRTIERYVLQGKQSQLTHFSNCVKEVIALIRDKVLAGGGTVIFDGGDSILFKGDFDLNFIREILELFEQYTGNTSSIGTGESMLQAYLGLKMAKSIGGNKIVHFKNYKIDEQ